MTALLAAAPRNRDAQLQLANLDLLEGHPGAALRRFNHLISEDPTDAEALQGNVRVAYYRGDLAYARNLAAKLVDDDPQDVSALLLLAHLERALHHAPQARALLYRARALDPRNAEGRELENSLRDDSRPTLHTSASFAREIGSGSPSDAEDLSAFGYENTWGFFALPRSESHLSLAYLPSQSPEGGMQGAVGPSELLYQQTTYVTPQLTLRGGVGLVRFGPGELTGIPTQEQPISAAGARPLGFAGLSYKLRNKLTVDLAAGRSAITYTPTSVRLGVMEDRVSMGWDYHFNSKTDLRLEPFLHDDSTIAYSHVIGPSVVRSGALQRGRSQSRRRRFPNLRPQVVPQIHRGCRSWLFRARLWDFRRGTKALPGIFQPRLLPTPLPYHACCAGKIHGPLGFDFSSGAGVQQVERSTPLKPALLLSPALTLKASPRLLLTLGYTYYDSSQSLGTLRGNAVRLSTDWRF